MPATLNVPVAVAAFASIVDVDLSASAESPIITLSVSRADQNGAPMSPQRVQMTVAAFHTAYAGAVGTWKQRIYAVALAQIGQTAVVT